MKKFAGLLLIVALALTLSSAALAVFMTDDPTVVGVGARPLGMGRAFTAIDSDPSDIFINPSGLATIKDWKAMTMQASLLQEVNYISLAAAQKVNFGVLGVGYVNSSIANIPLMVLNGNTPEATGENATYSNSVIYLSLSNKFDALPYSQNLYGYDLLGWMKDANVGANLKIFNQALSGSATVDAKGVGFNMDLGASWKATDWANIGIAVQNVLPTALGGQMIWSGNSDAKEAFPKVIKVGAAFKVEKIKSIITLDNEMNYSLKRPDLWRLGAEWMPIPVMALRAGIDQQASATEGGVDNNLTAGVGLLYRDWQFDYAYHQAGAGINDGITHYFSLGYNGDLYSRKNPPVVETPTKETIYVTVMSTPEVVKVYLPQPEPTVIVPKVKAPAIKAKVVVKKTVVKKKAVRKAVKKSKKATKKTAKSSTKKPVKKISGNS